MASKDITIRFYLGKGVQLYRSDFSEAELADIRRCLFLVIDYHWRRPRSPKILSVQILYDGITPFQSDDPDDFGEFTGLRVDPNLEYPIPLMGTPTPILRFHLETPMNENNFLIAVAATYYSMHTQSIDEAGEERGSAEDHNGYSSVLTEGMRENMITSLKYYGVYCGKTFDFPDGKLDFLIPATEFALPPTP